MTHYHLYLLLALVSIPSNSSSSPTIFGGKKRRAPINELKVSPDGTKIATIALDGAICIWNTHKEKKEHELPYDYNHRRYSLDWHPDSTHLTIAKRSSAHLYPLPILIQWWNAKTKRYLQTPPTSLDMRRFDNMSWSPRGNFLAVSGQDYREAGITYLVDPEGRIQHRVTHDWRIRECSWHPSGKSFASAAESSKEKLPHSEYPVYDDAGHLISTYFEFTPSEKPDEGELKLKFWAAPDADEDKPPTLQGKKSLQHDMFYLAWSPDGRYLASIDSRGTVHICAPHAQKEDKKILTHFRCPALGYPLTVKWHNLRQLAIGDHLGIHLVDPLASNQDHIESKAVITLAALLENIPEKPDDFESCIHSYDVAKDGTIFVGSGSGHIVTDRRTIPQLKFRQQCKELALPTIAALRKRLGKAAHQKLPAVKRSADGQREQTKRQRK